MRSMIAAAGVLILLGACAPGPAESGLPVADDAVFSSPAAAPPSEAQSDCKARNGEMRRVGMLGSWQCIVRYADAGKQCTDGDQCEGDCRANVDLPPPSPARSTPPPVQAAGVCQADSNPFGCYGVIEDGEAQPMICVD